MTPAEIKAARKRLGLSVEAFGERVGVSGRAVEAWECGLRKPNKSALLLMAAMLETKQAPVDPR